MNDCVFYLPVDGTSSSSSLSAGGGGGGGAGTPTGGGGGGGGGSAPDVGGGGGGGAPDRSTAIQKENTITLVHGALNYIHASKVKYSQKFVRYILSKISYMITSTKQLDFNPKFLIR